MGEEDALGGVTAAIKLYSVLVAAGCNAVEIQSSCDPVVQDLQEILLQQGLFEVPLPSRWDVEQEVSGILKSGQERLTPEQFAHLSCNIQRLRVDEASADWKTLMVLWFKPLAPTCFYDIEAGPGYGKSELQTTYALALRARGYVYGVPDQEVEVEVVGETNTEVSSAGNAMVNAGTMASRTAVCGFNSKQTWRSVIENLLHSNEGCWKYAREEVWKNPRKKILCIGEAAMCTAMLGGQFCAVNALRMQLFGVDPFWGELCTMPLLRASAGYEGVHGVRCGVLQ